MMKDLLEKNFVSHYKLDKYNTVNVVSTKDADFDLVDDVKLVHPSGEGIAKYSNPNRKQVNIINYENFFKSLPQPFQQNNATKQCCYFNKKVQSPSTKINAPTAFSKLSEVVPHGSKMSNSTIESYDFELWEFSGNETYLFKDNSTA